MFIVLALPLSYWIRYCERFVDTPKTVRAKVFLGGMRIYGGIEPDLDQKSVFKM